MTASYDPAPALATFVSGVDASSPSARLRARILLADAVVLSQSNAEVQGFGAVHEVGSGSGAHLSWATGHRLGAADAVHANSVAVHARFQDDTEMRTWSHPGSFVVPAAVAAAIESGTDFGCLIDSLIVGYSVTRWLGASGEVAAQLKERGLRPSPTFAPLGAAAAASRALGLSPAQVEQALNAAALLARGTLHSVGAGGDDWRLHNASGARDGFTVALAASLGMRSGNGALTARNGFIRTVTGSENVPAAWQQPPTVDLIEAVWHKALPALGDDMSVALAARELGRRLHGQPLDAVRVWMNAHYAAFPGTQTLPPYDSATKAQASVRYVTSQLLLTGNLTYRDLVRGSYPALDELATALEVFPDDELDFTDAIVEVDTAGDTLRCRCSDLPSTLFYRDRAEQLAVAEELLGDRGSRLAVALIDADDSTSVSDVFDLALASTGEFAH